MSWRLRKPRCIGEYEARIIRRLIEIGADQPPSDELLASIQTLVVREEGQGSFLHDSLEFLGAGRNRIIASAIGTMTNGEQVELILWANGRSITYLELEPFEGARRPIRMPLLETIRPYPEAEDDPDAA